MGESKPLIVIPARIGSTRLKNKPLREINGVPLITHVCLRALEADIGPVIVSSDDERVLQATPAGVGGYLAKMIPDEHCGSDRVAHAVELEGHHDYIINLQGDMPFIDPQILRDLWAKRQESTVDIVSAQCMTKHVVISENHFDYHFMRKGLRQHIGLYAFTCDSLKKFASLEPSERELRTKLEICRTMSLTLEFIEVDHMPLEINTESDLKHANLIAEALWRSEDIRPRYRGADAVAGVVGERDWGSDA